MMIDTRDQGHLSLQEIEGDDWGDPPGPTRLISTALELRRVPIGSLDIEDLRLLIGQDIGLDALMPLALARLAVDPLAEGDFYPGDLLAALLKVPPAYWSRHPDHRRKVEEVIASVDDLDDELLTQIEAFRSGGAA